jgi:hypothetical protein
VLRRIYKGDCCNKTMSIFLAVAHTHITNYESIRILHVLPVTARWEASHVPRLITKRCRDRRHPSWFRSASNTSGTSRHLVVCGSHIIRNASWTVDKKMRQRQQSCHHFLQPFDCKGRRGHLVRLKVVCYLMARTVYPQPRRPSVGMKGR